MDTRPGLLVGEFVVAIDSDHRLTLPQKVQSWIQTTKSQAWVLAKQQPGALSLWSKSQWDHRVGKEVARLEATMQSEIAPIRLSDVQRFMRLVSARSAEVKVSAKGRLTIPTECRDFLAIKVPGNCVVVGTGVAIEIWQPDRWQEYLQQEMGGFAALQEQLTTT